MERQPVVLELNVSALSDDELRFLSRQAEPVGRDLVSRRAHVAQIFLFVASAADGALEHRALGLTATQIAEADPDLTAPLSHQATDLGYAMARVVPLLEDPEASRAVRRFWNQLLQTLGAELRRRGPPA